MALKVGQAFLRVSKNPIDDSFVLSKAEMIGINDDLMPEKYFCVCSDDGLMYTYDKSATPSSATGKFKEVVGGNVDHPVVQTKQDLYTLDNTYRGMIVYVIDEDQYYKLINDLPSYEASWVIYTNGMEEVTESEIDAMFT